MFLANSAGGISNSGKFFTNNGGFVENCFEGLAKSTGEAVNSCLSITTFCL